jgi:oxygen tolerance protein BatD
VTGIPFVALLLVQGSAPDITASVDRTRITVGDQVTLTVEVRVSGGESPRLELPPLDGFSVLGTREAADVSLQGVNGLMRTAVRALTLQAERPGRLVIGPVRVRVGDRVAATEPLTIVVDSAAAFSATTLSPVARSLLAGAALPLRGDQVALSIVLPERPLRIGQQLDLLLAAWFPRDLRTRLRRPPQLTLQTPQAVWALPPSAPSDVVLSRQVRGRWMDLYAVHQVLFPLSPGRIVVPPSSMTYAVPMSFSFFSTEERYSLTTDSTPFTVLPLPAAGRSEDDQGVVAADLHLDIATTPSEARVGEPVELAVTLRGTGNPSLWPPPALRLPPALRSYSGETTTRIGALEGRVGGTKTFRYMLVPDSAGAFLLPAVRYPYFDSDAGDYRVLTAGARSIVATPGGDPQASRPLPPLLPAGARPWADRVAGALGLAGWLAIVLLPPAFVWWRSRRRVPVATPAAAPIEGTRLGDLERQFLKLLTARVADAPAREGTGLVRALQVAGVDRSVALHVVRVRDRLRAARYGPRGVEDFKSLQSELEQVLRSLESERIGRRSRASGLGASLAVLLSFCAAGAAVRAQGMENVTGAEALYRAGALRAAADSFAARAAADTLNPAHWYDLGAALYGSGADGKAVAAWVTAQRLAPRNAVIRHARTLLPAPDAITEDLLEVGPVTPGECALVAAALWVACWGALLLSRRRAIAAVLGVLALGAAVFGQVERHRRARPVGVIVSAATPVRAAPYGSASASIVLGPGVAVLVEDQFNGGQWLRVRRPDGVQGWVQAGQVARL